MEFSNHTKHLTLYSLQGRFIGNQDGGSLLQSFEEALEKGEKYFILNLKDLQFINSTGLGVFTTLLSRVRKVEGEIILLNLSASVANVFAITKLNSVFSVCNSWDEAIALVPEK